MSTEILSVPDTGKASKRMAWVDIMKCFAIFMVFLAHTQRSGIYMRMVHDSTVAAFFFCTGFFALRHPDFSFWGDIRKNIHRLMIPYVFFSLLSIVPLYAFHMSENPGAFGVVLRTAAGMRDHLTVPALWFFPALFCCIAMFDVLRLFAERIKPGNVSFRNIFLLGSSMVLWAIAGIARPLTGKWLALPWSLDSAMEFLPFYILGALTFPYLAEFHFSEKKRRTQIITLVLCVLSIGYTLACLIKPTLTTAWLPVFREHPFQYYAACWIQTFPVVFAAVVLAKMIDRESILTKIGSATFLLCCTEFYSDVISMQIEQFFPPVPHTPLAGVILAFARMMFAFFVLVPLCRKFLPFVSGESKTKVKK